MGTEEGLYRTKTYWNLRADGYSKSTNVELEGKEREMDSFFGKPGAVGRSSKGA